MAHCCPTCGRPFDVKTEAEKLFELLTTGTPHRQVYRGSDGSWYVTYGGGPFSRNAVDWLVRQGRIQSVYSNCPTDAYHIGKTLDYERTMEARRRLGKKAPSYFVGDAE